MIVDFSFNVDLQIPAGYQEIVKFDASANDNEQKAEGAENKGYAGSTSQISRFTFHFVSRKENMEVAKARKKCFEVYKVSLYILF